MQNKEMVSVIQGKGLIQSQEIDSKMLGELQALSKEMSKTSASARKTSPRPRGSGFEETFRGSAKMHV